MAASGEMFAEDITWHEFGCSPLAGTYADCAEVMKLDLGRAG